MRALGLCALCCFCCVIVCVIMLFIWWIVFCTTRRREETFHSVSISQTLSNKLVSFASAHTIVCWAMPSMSTFTDVYHNVWMFEYLPSIVSFRSSHISAPWCCWRVTNTRVHLPNSSLSVLVLHFFFVCVFSLLVKSMLGDMDKKTLFSKPPPPPPALSLNNQNQWLATIFRNTPQAKTTAKIN